MSSSLSKAVQAFIKRNPVAVFSKSFCPFCLQVKNSLDALNISYKAIELDNDPRGSDIQAELLRTTNQRTVPNVFANGQHIGGCDDTLAALKSGMFMTLLKGDKPNTTQ